MQSYAVLCRDLQSVCYVRGLLHQRVLEAVFRIRRRPAPEDQFGSHELRQSVIDLLLRHSGDGADQLI
jgi:hypothetical protein